MKVDGNVDLGIVRGVSADIGIGIIDEVYSGVGNEVVEVVEL